MADGQTASPKQHPTWMSLISLGCVAACFVAPPMVLLAAASADAQMLNLASLILGNAIPLVVLLAVVAAHWAWWTQMSGDYERGLGWALAAMIVSHATLAFWMISCAALLGGAQAVSIACIYLLVIFVAVAVVMRSAAAKYLIVASVMLALGLSIVVLKLRDLHHLSQTTASMNQLRDWGQKRADEQPRDKTDLDVPVGDAGTNDSDAESWWTHLPPSPEE